MKHLRIWVFFWIFLWVLAFSAENSLALTGVPRYESSPARASSPAFGFWYGNLFGVEDGRVGAGGELGGKNIRVGFLSEYNYLDSIYSQSYSEMDLGYSLWLFNLGLAYGFSMEWIPAENMLIRHRYKLGVSFAWKEFYLGGMLFGWFDDVKNSGFLVGGGLNVGGAVDFFFEWNGNFLDIGANVMVKNVRLSSAYRFPGFGATFSLSIFIDQWLLEGAYGFTNESFDRIEMGASKKLKKKTIL